MNQPEYCDETTQPALTVIGTEGDVAIWIDIAPGDPTESFCSFILGTGDTLDEALSDATDTVERIVRGILKLRGAKK